MNDYASRQRKRDTVYAREYDTWVQSLTPDERSQLEAQGLLRPMIDSAANARSQDAADMHEASYEPDIAGAIDRAGTTAAMVDAGTLAGDTLASFCARVRSTANPLLVFDAVCFATGVLALDGKSQTELAKAHGVSRAAFSKVATQWCKTFGIKPSRGMKSERARRAYERRAKADWKRRAARSTPKKAAPQVDVAPKA